MIASSHIAQLRALLDDNGLLTEPGDMVPYQTGARHDEGRAAFVARPSSTIAVSRLLAYCCRNEIALVPQGGNTGLVGGSIPDMTGAQGVLSLDRLRKIFEPDIFNRSVRVDAGLRLSEINARLAPHRLFFPIDLGADPTAGGMVSTNTGGARFIRFGDVRRNVLGLKVVLADDEGTILNLGTGLRKDNTGPDWKHLFIGTSGAFGVVTECELNLERLLNQSATAYLVPRSDSHVMALLAALEEHLGSQLSAFEGMSGSAIRHALAHSPALKNPFPGGQVPSFVILVEVSRSWTRRSTEEPLEALLETALEEIWRDPAEPLIDAFVGPPREMWGLRHALSEGVKAAGHLVAFDLAFRRGDSMRFRTQMESRLSTCFPTVEICDFGHIGDGGIHFNLVIAENPGEAVEGSLIESLRHEVNSVAVEMFGGSFSAEHALGRRNQHLYDRYTPLKLRRFAAALKQVTSASELGAVRVS
ncbi:FAD-binding oxidoreductase [Mesorhizobium qingshengii]|uniref:FAD/FMN-containing dehydrogenase n=1 Tax=Mesorhizobium qingshengii TaxID=1165689 RepID=A0A1G5Z9W9_9HYPH|nr:FAD-binding oxidoreductase [Mesorhizobium qingshengii]SDA91442.1 FAD/FMN-containing dehydrogenase [Mesorhizobium qingshengii]